MKKEIRKKLIKQAKGITLISLVITIIILLILAGVTLSLTLGDNGIITQAQKAKEAQEIAAIKEDIQLAILDKELEKGGEGLTEEELEEILKDYGEIQEDGNTIITDDGYEIDIDEIYKPGGGTGGDAATDEELAALLEKIKELEQTVTDLTNTKTELEGTIEDLNRQLEEEQGNNAELQEQIENLQGQVDTLNKTIEQQQSTIDSLNTQIAELQKKQSTGNAVAADVLENKTFSNSSNVGIKGTMANRGTLNWSNSNTTYNVPAGYYSGGTLDSRPSYNAGYSAGNTAGYNNGYNAGVSAGNVDPAYLISMFALDPSRNMTYYVPGSSGVYTDSKNITVGSNGVTIQRAGTYKIICVAIWTGTDSSNMYAHLYINGSKATDVGINSVNGLTGWYSGNHALNVGNTVQVLTGSTGGSSDCIVGLFIEKVG